MNKITIISGSHRKDSESKKIANVLAEKLAAMDNCDTTDYLDLAEVGLPFWSESYTDEEQAIIDNVAARLEASDGFLDFGRQQLGTERLSV